MKVALIGTGFVSTQKHLPAWRRMRSTAEIVALCDTDLRRGKEVADRFGITKVYEDVDTALEQEHPDIVDICTPPRTHATLAIQAVKAGAHILIEKPMAVTTEECDLIIQAAEETDRKVCIVHSDLFYPSFLKARELVHRGAIGDFQGMRIYLSTPVDYITSNPDHWAHNLPGGVVGETGPHIVYMSLAFINPIRQVQVYAQKVLPEFPWSPFEDYRINLIGENAASTATLTYTTDQWAAQVDIWGSKGLEVLPEELGQAKAQGEGGGKDQLKVHRSTLYTTDQWADLESRCVVRHRRPKLTPMAVGISSLSEATQTVRSVLTTGAKVLTGRFLDTHSLLIQRFCESIQNQEEPPVTAYAGREVVRVMDLIVEQLQQTRA